MLIEWITFSTHFQRKLTIFETVDYIAPNVLCFRCVCVFLFLDDNDDVDENFRFVIEFSVSALKVG